MTTFAGLAARGSLLVNDGYRTKSTELGEPGFPVLRVAEVGDGVVTPSYGDHVRAEYRAKIGYKLSRAGDVLLTTKGTVGRRAIMPALDAEFAYSPQLCFFRVLDESIDPRWLYYWLGGNAFWTQALGVSQQTDMAPYISLRDLRSITVDLPSIEEQRAIAATLGPLDDKIESNRRCVALSLELLDALSSQQSAVQPRVALGSIAQLVKAVAKPSSYGDQIVSHYSIPAFDAGARAERVAASSVMSNKVALSGPAILVSRLNPRFNRTWWVAPDAADVAFASPEFAMLRADNRRALAGVWLAVRDETFRDEVSKRVTGTSGSHQRIRPDDMLAIEVPDSTLMPDGVLDSSLALLDRVDSLRTEIDALSSLRDALLPELLSRRVRVPIREAA